MKKYCFYALSMLAVATWSVSLTSCKDDDDDNSGSVAASDTPSPTVTDSYGAKHRVTSFGDYSYSYDKNGKLTAIYDDDELIQSGSGLTFRDKGKDEYDEWDCTIKFALNQRGYVSEASESFYDKDSDGEWERGTIHNSYTYDSEGQLNRITSTASGSYREDGKTYAFSWKDKTTLTWSDSKLLQVTYEWTETDEGDDEDNDSGSYTYTLQYGTQANSARQWLHVIDRMVEDMIDFTEALSPLGLFGRGPAYLPIRYSQNGYSSTLAYTLNANGTIHSDNGRIYTYDDATRSTVAVAPTTRQVPSKNKVHNIHKRFQARKMARKL